MQTAILNSASSVDLKLLTDIAKKMGIKVKYISEDQKEDFAMLQAITKGRTKSYVDTDNFLAELKK
jgi:hypothetical protein